MQGNEAMISQTIMYVLLFSCTTSEVSNVLDAIYSYKKQLT